MKRFALITIATASVLTATGCSTSAPITNPTAEKVYVTAPLTGIKYEEGTTQANALKNPSVACKIDNSDAARPQLGLNRTDVVFDEMVEGGLTRFVAIWHSDQPDAVAPVRSIRPMDPDILSPFGGIVCYSGGQPGITAMMLATNVFNASETTEAGKGTFTRLKDRIAPHNVQVNTSLLAQNHPEIPAPAAQFNYAQDLANSTAALQGKPVKDVSVYFPLALANWATNSDATAFLRTQDGKALTDAADGSQIRTVNIVIMQVTIDYTYADRKYGNVPKDVVIGTGKGWVLSGGKVVEVTWSKLSQTTSITFALADGTPVQLAPGNTWVELQPNPEGKTVFTYAPTPSPAATN